MKLEGHTFVKFMAIMIDEWLILSIHIVKELIVHGKYLISLPLKAEIG